MTAQGILPIAPRPEGDELLSSWQARVACRYGLTPDELSRWLDATGDDRRTGFLKRDFAPSAGTRQAWAAACRLSEPQIESMVLSSQPRSRSWYVWGEGRGPGIFRRPICLECLAEDAAGGRDHHFRRSWAFVETFVCDRHGCALEETCQHCRSILGFRFLIADEAVRLACVACGVVLEARRIGGSHGLFGSLSASIAVTLGREPGMGNRMMEAARLLWTRPRLRTGRRLPFIVDTVPYLRLPPSVAAWVDPDEPLAPLGWRMMTWLGVAKLLELGGPWQDLSSNLPTIDRIREWVEEPKKLLVRKEVTPEVSTGSEWTLRRSDAEYLALAWSIVRSDKWREARAKDTRTRQRVLGALIDTALTRRTEAAP